MGKHIPVSCCLFCKNIQFKDDPLTSEIRYKMQCELSGEEITDSQTILPTCQLDDDCSIVSLIREIQGKAKALDDPTPLFYRIGSALWWMRWGGIERKFVAQIIVAAIRLMVRPAFDPQSLVDEIRKVEDE